MSQYLVEAIDENVNELRNCEMYWMETTTNSEPLNQPSAYLAPIIHEKSVERSRSIFRNSLRTVGVI